MLAVESSGWSRLLNRIVGWIEGCAAMSLLPETFVVGAEADMVVF